MTDLQEAGPSGTERGGGPLGLRGARELAPTWRFCLVQLEGSVPSDCFLVTSLPSEEDSFSS